MHDLWTDLSSLSAVEITNKKFEISVGALRYNMSYGGRAGTKKQSEQYSSWRKGISQSSHDEPPTDCIARSILLDCDVHSMQNIDPAPIYRSLI
jgi:hypothetical protein